MTILLNPAALFNAARVDAEREIDRAREVISRLSVYYTRNPNVSYETISGRIDSINHYVAAVQDSFNTLPSLEAATKALSAQLVGAETFLEKTPTYQHGVATKLNATGVQDSAAGRGRN